jgi:hypothetical protein
MELLILKGQILKEFKGQLYNNVVKQLKKYNKKQDKKQTKDQHLDAILNERQKVFSSCKMEYTILSKEFKQD